MEQEDYIKRQIDQLARVVGKILLNFLGFKQKGQVSIGIEITNQALKSELDFDIQELINIPDDNFINILLSKKQFNNYCFGKLFELLFLIADDTEDKEKKKIYEKCIILLEYLEEKDKVYCFDRQLKLKQIKDYLEVV